MGMVVYLDSVFIINTLVNYFLLRLTARLMSTPPHRLRCAFSAGVGGIYAAAVFLMGNSWVEEAAVKLALGVVLCLIAFGNERRFFRGIYPSNNSLDAFERQTIAQTLNHLGLGIKDSIKLHLLFIEF